CPLRPQPPPAHPAITEAVEIAIKYQGYIARQLREVEEMRKLESRPLPPDLDYTGMAGLRLEARQKLQKIQPLNLGQASRVSGVSPADVSALMVWLEHNREGRA
ncbi:MAG: tRNA uridine-5-carboxymethylaminomethyl(34) synthesis enzyme MnmG, partial [Pseudoflavonifractor sp.]